MTLHNQVAVITGAAGGIGLVIAQRYARDGARVVLADRQAEAVGNAAQALRDASYVVWSFAGDSADETAVQALG